MVLAIRVELGERSYEIVIEPGVLVRLGEELRDFAQTGRLMLVSDETVWNAQGERLMAGLRPLEADLILVPPGEPTKSWAGLSTLIDALVERGISRNDHVVAFGGGVVGDLAGFAAAIVKRGCSFIQIPTSLLAQVDSSVGGKTGINIAAGKNMVGAFHQPQMVLVDPELLATLDPRHLRAGYAEIVKSALIHDRGLFEWLELNGANVLNCEPEALVHAICASIDIKRQIVERDERELGGQRALLNLGHTFAHALEAETGFSDRLFHGEAVAVGLVYAYRLSERLGLCATSDADRVEAHLRSVGLPVRYPADPGVLIAHMRHDKKAREGRIPFVLARGIGRAFLSDAVELHDVETFLRDLA